MSVAIGLLSNERLQRNVNWSLLSDSLFSEIERLGQGTRFAPAAGRVFEVARALQRDRRRGKIAATLVMNGRARPDWRLLLLAGAAGTAPRSVFYVDPWPFLLRKIGLVDRLFGFDPVFIPYREAHDILAAGPHGHRYHYLPYAADTRVFRPHSGERDIDIFWMGRRDERLHAALRGFAERRGLTYWAREETGLIADPAELGLVAARARYFVVTPPDEERSGGFSPLVMRYLEGLAAGCRLLGTLPKSGEFERLLPRASLLEIAPDGTNLERQYDADQADAAGWAASAAAHELVHRHHGWDSRAKEVVRVISEVVQRRAA